MQTKRRSNLLSNKYATGYIKKNNQLVSISIKLETCKFLLHYDQTS